jgi:hypothetical protein
MTNKSLFRYTVTAVRDGKDGLRIETVVVEAKSIAAAAALGLDLIRKTTSLPKKWRVVGVQEVSR